MNTPETTEHFEILRQNMLSFAGLFEPTPDEEHPEDSPFMTSVERSKADAARAREAGLKRRRRR